MKVTNNPGPNISNIESGKSKPVDDKIAKTTGELAKLGESKDQSAKVQLSDKAQLMQRAKEIALNAPDTDEAKIARLQKMIDEGKYRVDADAVADRLVDNHLLYNGE